MNPLHYELYNHDGTTVAGTRFEIEAEVDVAKCQAIRCPNGQIIRPFSWFFIDEQAYAMLPEEEDSTPEQDSNVMKWIRLHDPAEAPFILDCIAGDTCWQERLPTNWHLLRSIIVLECCGVEAIYSFPEFPGVRYTHNPDDEFVGMLHLDNALHIAEQWVDNKAHAIAWEVLDRGNFTYRDAIITLGQMPAIPLTTFFGVWYLFIQTFDL